MKRQRALAQPGDRVEERRQKSWKLGASQGQGLPRALLLRFPHVREIQGSLCGHCLFAPYPDLVLPLIWF
jgi:hypothetical protein